MLAIREPWRSRPSACCAIGRGANSCRRAHARCTRRASTCVTRLPYCGARALGACRLKTTRERKGREGLHSFFASFAASAFNRGLSRHDDQRRTRGTRRENRFCSASSAVSALNVVPWRQLVGHASDDSMRILIANDGFGDAGGVQSYLDRVTSGLAARGHAVAILHRDGQPAAFAAASTYRFPQFSVAHGGVETTLAAVYHWRPDVCFSHNMD